MTISLTKLQELFNQRADLSNELGQVEQRIRELVGEPATESAEELKPKRGRKPRAAVADGPETSDTNPSESATAANPPSSPPDEPFAPSAVGVVILGAMNPGTTYSGAEIYQLTLDASSPDTDPVELKAAVKSEIRLLYTSGHLAKSGEGPATRYTKTC
ncbi:MAG: hypothetical protein A2Z03_12180 [Chloroflexi bacterium RBG_16_56_8]|nr:MAG: hypothetical protein A2Z03_12180 [Chloroflexi bacterium RBG_16_56_8]